MKKEKTKDPHFVKVIAYSDEPWRTDFIFGQKGAESHGHLVASGAMIYHLHDEQGKDIIKNGSVVVSEDEDRKDNPLKNKLK